MSYLSRIKQVEEEKRRQSGTGAKPQTGTKAGTGAAARVNASGTIKATVKTNAEKPKAARTVSVPGAGAAGKAAGGQARTVDARVTWSTLSDMKQRGAIPSAAKTRAADVRTVKPAGSDAAGTKSTQTGAAGMKIKPLDLNDTAANTSVNALIRAQGGASTIQSGSNGVQGGTSVFQSGAPRGSFIANARAAGEAADQRQGGADSLNESGIVGSIAKVRRENEQAGRALMGGLDLNETSANSALEGMAPVLSSPEVQIAQEGVHWDPLGGLSAQEKTEALLPIIENSDYYRQSRAQIDAQAGALDAEILSLDGQIASLGEESFSEAQTLRARRNQLKMQRYYAQDKLDNLADETRVRLTDAGVLKGSLTPEEKIRYDVDQIAASDGAAGFFETLGRTAATTGHQIVDSTPRDLATTYVTAMAAMAGVQSPADWLEAHPEQKAIFDRAYSPTQDLSDYSGSFGSEGWDTFQKLEQSAAESLKTMAISYGLGAVGAGSAGAGAGHVTRIMQWVNSGISAAAGAAREAATAGADAHDAGAAFLFTGIANAYLEQGGADKVFENAARLGQKIAGTGAGGKIVSRLCPAGVKKVADAIKSSKYGWIYEAGLDVFKSFFSEGFEEAAEDAVGNAIAKAVYDKDMPWTGEGGVIDGAQYMEDGLIGGGMGAAFTVIGGLLMPGQYRAHLLSQSALDEVKRGMPISKKQIADINAAIDAEIRAGEKSISDVDAHAGIWRANGQETPESLKNWRAAAENAGKAQSVYEAARRGVEQLISDMESGAVDVSTEQGVKSYNAVMAEYSVASEKLSQAARENVSARDTYYTDEDALSAQVDGKSSAAIERMDEIAQVLREPGVAGDVDARKLNSPEAQEVIRAADEAIMSRDALAGEIEQTVEDEKNAPSPGEALEAIERRRQLSAEYVVARQQAEEVLTWLREAVRNDSPERLNERMEEGRARNRENGKYDEKYDGISTRELSAERERLNLRIEQVENELEGAHGSRYRRLEREAERLYDERGAVEAEILLRGEVYGARPDGIGESAQVSDRPAAVIADDFGNENAPAMGGGDVQSVDNAPQMRTEVQNQNTPAELRTSANGYVEVFSADGQVDIERAQEMLDSANTGVTYKPAGEYSADEIRNIQGYLQSVDKNMVELCEEYRANKNGKFKRYTISPVTDVEASDISALTGTDLSGYVHAIDKNGFNHIEKRHGINGENDSNMSNASDVARIGYVLANYDSVELARNEDGTPDVTYGYLNAQKQPANKLIYSKKINGTMYVIEAAGDNAYKKLWVITAYLKNDNKKKSLRETSNAISPRLTSETQDPSRSSTTIISQGDANVNGGVNATSGGIYANGKPLFSAMTDAELFGEIAREADGGRLAELRSERENRTGQESAERRARSARLDEIEGIIRDAPRAEDGELSRQERYLRRRTAQLDSEIEVARDSGDDVKGLTDELRRTQESLNAIHVEQQRRAQARREAGESLINEIRDANPGAGRTDAQQERERIRQSQRAGREALDALKAERDGRRAWRTTDAISIEEAARVFTDGAGAEDGADIEGTLKANQEVISQWEQRRAQLSGAEADLQEELSSLLKQQTRMAQEDANRLSADDVRERLNINERIIRIQNDMDQVKGLRQQIDSSLRYLNAHAGEGVIETLRSGRIPEQMMERIMGYVDEIRVPKSGATGMNMNTPARVFDDLFGDASPVMRAIYVDPIAEHEADRQRYIAGAREKIAALKLNSAESELVQRVGEGVMTADELDKAISEGLARRGSKLKSGDGTWQEGAESAAQNADTVERAREALSRAVMNNPLQAGHEYRPGDYDELIKKVQADGGTHTGAEWEKILGFEGKNPRASNLERFVHNTQERIRNRSNGINSQSSQEVVSANELLEFMRDEMASDAANMRLRQAQYERILAHENVPVHVLERTTLTTRDRYADARGKAQFGDAVNSDTGNIVTLNKEGYGKTLTAIKQMPYNVRPAALAALANYKTLIADGVYVGSYPDYGESANIKQMHCFVSAFEYGGEQYRAMYTAKESRNSDGSYSTKLYLQRVEALKAKNNAAEIEDRITHNSSDTGINYINTSAADTSIASPSGAVNTIDAKTLLEGYNLSALKAWPLAKIDMEELRAGDADSGWGRKADEVRRINHAVKVFNGIYEELYNMVNDAYVRNGYEKMGRRKNYFPHFQEEESNLFENFARRLGFGAGKYALPTSIDGLTETFSPGRNYNKHAEHRLGTDTAFDAIAGFEDYIESATKAAYLTDDIKRLRQLEREIRAGEEIGTLTSRTKLSKANGDFGSLAKWVHEYANIVAGKKSTLDRGVENVVGRRVYQVLDTIRSRRGASAVAGNISSALTNIAPVAQVISEHPVAAVKGMMSMMCELMRGESGTPQSRFLARRFTSDQLGVGRLARIEKIAGMPFEIVDTIASNIVLRACYQSNIDAGMEPEAAMRSADAQAARLMADRSLGQMPNLYSSRLFMGTLGQFQLEVANNLKWMKDITRTYSPGRAAAILTLLAVMSKLTNEAWKQLTGRDLILDPISAVQEGVSAGREAAQQGGAWQALWKGVSAGVGELGGNLPYISGGRIGTNLISDAIDAAGNHFTCKNKESRINGSFFD